MIAEIKAEKNPSKKAKGKDNRIEKMEQKITERIRGKKAGQIELMTGLFLVLFFTFFLLCQLQLLLYQTVGGYVEDALAASNLASAVIDLEEYGLSHQIIIAEPEEAFHRYQTALKGNLNLGENWECRSPSMIAGVVEIRKYIIYNVREKDVDIYTYNGESGSWIWEKERLGEVYSPDGIRIESTSIYSEIEFPVEIIKEIKTQARKGKLVDIVGEEC